MPWAAWTSSSVTPAFYCYGRVLTLGSGLKFGNALIPVEDLRAVPMQHALVLVDVLVDRLEIFDPVRLPADVGMDRQHADFRAFLALGVEPVELIDGAFQEIVALVMLDQHHG